MAVATRLASVELGQLCWAFSQALSDKAATDGIGEPLLVLRQQSAVLCCAVLCCAVLCCAVLCCAVLCCAVLCAPECEAFE